jgi:hypothetical protein
MKRFSVSRWLAAGIIGAMVFWLFQRFTGPATITQFMGEQIVSQGRYPAALVLLIGWGVHVGVSLGYSLLYAIILLLPVGRSQGGQLVGGLMIAVLLGWGTTLLAAPAITVTISILSGKDFPVSLPGLNTTYGLPFWNHMLFFAVLWFIYAVIPGGRR